MAIPKLIPDDELPDLDQPVMYLSADDQRALNYGRTKRRNFNQEVKNKVDERFDEMFGKARKNIARAIERGDREVSMWFIDTYLKRQASRVKMHIKGDPSTPEGLRDIANNALVMAHKGEIGLYQLKLVQEAIARHLMLADSAVIGDLRRQVEDLAQAVATKNQSQDHLPAWGRLRAVTSEPPAADDADFEDDLNDTYAGEKPRSRITLMDD